MSSARAIDLLDHASSVYSQNGEDGILTKLFAVIGTGSRQCCEFGAGDGVHLSNTRALLLSGWRGVLIEADAARFRDLVQTYAGAANVTCIHAMVDTASNDLQALLCRTGSDEEALDFLSIDIDGPDYEIFQALGVRPRVICVEVGAAHPPDATQLLPPEIASAGIGQPLPCFCEAAERLGYRLICYNGLNAFFLRRDIGHEAELPTLTPIEAYRRFLSRQSAESRRYLYYLNSGYIFPYFQFQNPYLSLRALGLSRWRTTYEAGIIVLRWRVADLLHKTPFGRAVRRVLDRTGVSLAPYDTCRLS